MAEQTIVEERNRWEAVFQRAPYGMAQVDLEGRWVAVNPAVCRLLSRVPDDLLATDFQALTHPQDRELGMDEFRRAIAGEIDTYDVEKRYLRGDGGVVWAHVHVTMVRGAGGEPLYLLAHIQDVTAHKQAEAQLTEYAEQLEELARQDPLTGLRNYRTFQAWLDAQVHVARRTRSECSVVLFDVDNFRDLNRRDRLEGDALLAKVAAVVKAACRSTDIAARIGSDEFALILPGAGASLARRVAHRIAADVERRGSVSVSFGVANWPTDGDDSEVLLLSADSELQSAKLRLHDRRRAEGMRFGGLDRPELEQIRQLVAVARRSLEVDVAYLTRIDDDTETVCAVDGEAAAYEVLEGGPPPDPDAGSDGLRISTPVRLESGGVFGVLCAAGRAEAPQSAEHDLDLMRSVASVIASRIESDRHDETIRRYHEEMAVMNALLSALSARDHYTGEHSKTVVRLAVAVARRMDLDDETVHQVQQVALLHDIGKVGIPDSILQKQGPLTIQEWKLMREHPAIGARILAGTRTLAHLAPAVHAEHERFDGTGYPNGLRGSAIPIASRITLACDAYDAMTTDRPYRVRLPVAQAAEELFIGAGTEFDPDVVAALVAELGMDLTATEAEPARASSPAPVG